MMGQNYSNAALSLAQRAVFLSQQSGSVLEQITAKVNLAYIHLGRGESDEVRTQVGEVEELVEGIGVTNPGFAAKINLFLSDLKLERGNLEKFFAQVVEGIG